MIAGYVKSVTIARRAKMNKEYITLAHYPQREDLELHQSSYGLCTECSTFTKYVPYPCSVVEEAGNE
jgi:hypothetical protein